MDRDVCVLFGLTIIATLAAAPVLMAGGFPLLPLLLAGISLTCTVHKGSRALVCAAAAWLVSGGVLKTIVVLLGGVMLIQLVPLELALFMAGDVLAYVEVVAAVGLIAANRRLHVIRTAVAARLEHGWIVVRCRIERRAPRSVRLVRTRKPPSSDDELARDYRSSPDAYFSARVTAFTSTYSSMPWIEPSRP